MNLKDKLNNTRRKVWKQYCGEYPKGKYEEKKTIYQEWLDSKKGQVNE